jgi:hypothetical protein
MGRGNTTDRIGGARSGRHQTDAYLSGGPCISIGRMDGPLLMTNQDMLKIGFHQRIVNIDNSRSGITENGIHPFIFQGFKKYFSSCEFNSNTPFMSIS